MYEKLIVHTMFMGVSKNRGTPKWMVYFMENTIKIDDLGVPLFLETPSYSIYFYISLQDWLLLVVNRVMGPL